MLFFTLLLLVALLYYFERGQTRFAIIAAIATAGALCLQRRDAGHFADFYFIFCTCNLEETVYHCLLNGNTISLLWFLSSIGILSVLYSSFGFHPETLVGQNFQIGLNGVNFQANTTGWYKAVDHWVAMHNEQRLGGPYYFYIPLFLLYELPIFILAIVGNSPVPVFKDLNFSGYYQRLKNWLRTRRFELSTEDLAATSLRQLQDTQSAGH